MFDAADLTDDGFLGGRLRILQPRTGYRAATDPVFLAAAVDARPGQSVLELGCGAGVASLCLAARVSGLALAGIELQSEYADLARRNAARNGFEMRVVEADLSHLPASLRAEQFDHVIANPPYYGAGQGTASPDRGRETAMRERTPLHDWIAVAGRRLRPGGWLTVIQSADRLADLVSAIPKGLGSLVILPLAPRAGHAANRVILQARKGGRARLRLLAPLVLHEGAAHDGDRDSHSDGVRMILREGAALRLSAR